VILTRFEIGTIKTEMAELRAALDEAREWRTMDTAPRDGTTILLSDGSEFVRMGFLTPTGNRWRSSAGLTIKPTAWMPLPDAPKKEL